MRGGYAELIFWLIASAIVAAVLLTAGSANAQTCDAEACAPLVNATADAACTRARAAELRIDEYRAAAAESEARWQQCLGALDWQQHIQPAAPFRTPLALRVVLDVLLVGGGIATGLALGTGAPPEWVVGFAVGEAMLLGGRLIVEWLER